MKDANETRRSRAPKAALLPFPAQHGGRRRGAGPKPKHGKPGVSHRQRSALAKRFPVHVTVKLKQGLPKLRQRAERAALRMTNMEGVVRPVTDACTWLLTVGWRKHGLLSVFELPATA